MKIMDYYIHNETRRASGRLPMRIMAGHLLSMEGFGLADVKPFKTYEEQLSILKRRGMIIEDEEYALKVLKSENYYRLSGYWLTMLVRAENDSEEDRFYLGTTFDNLMDLYEFDADLRSVVFDAVRIVETNIKSFVAYCHAEKYGPLGYLDSKNFNNAKFHSATLDILKKDVAINKNEAVIKHHIYNKGGNVPIWAIVDFMTFDQISRLYKNMLPQDKRYIAKYYYGIPNREYIENWIQCAVVARNIAAHSARFYNRHSYKPGVRLPDEYKIYANTFFGYVYAIYNLLPLESRDRFIEELDSCIKAHSYVKLEYLHLPNNWMEILRK